MLLQALNEFYRRASKPDSNNRILIEEASFTKKYIRWNIPLKSDGSLEGIGLTENPEIKKGGRVFSVPKTNRPKVAGGVAEFLWDGLEAVFCLKPDFDFIEPNKKKLASQIANRQAKFDDFWRQIETAFAETNSPLLNTLLQFRDNLVNQETPDFLRWGILNEGEKPCWLIKTASGTDEKLKTDNFTFQVNGKFLFEIDEIRSFWRNTFADERNASEDESEKGLCLVSGKTDVAISASHPKIKGVPGSLAMGASLISFDKDSFRSYGLEKNYNSPISFPAVEGYINSLNYLLSNQKHFVKAGNTKLLFWAGKSEEATDFFAQFFEKPDEIAVKKFLENSKRGLFAFKLEYDDIIYSVILGGNSGRIVVRNWLQIPLKNFVDNVASWFEDLELIKIRSHEKDKLPPLHHFRLAASTVRDSNKELKDEVSSQILRGLFHGHTPSISIIGNLVNRIAVDLGRDGKSSLGNLSRFSLLRLIVNRNLRKENKSMEIKPTLEESIIDPDLVIDYPYQCGRLLAVFEELQAAHHEYKLEGPSVVERYYGTASTSPNSAFGILWRLHTHHLRKVGRTNGDKGKAKAQAIKNKIAAITKHFMRKNPLDLTSPPEFPRSFNLQAQGRFALGFYQQIAGDKEARDAYFQNKKAEQNQQLKEGELN